MTFAAIALAAFAAAAAPASAPNPPAPPRRPVVVPAPAPPAPPLPGQRGYDRQRELRARQLREACLSEDGVRTILDSEDRSRAASGAGRPWEPIDRELGEAANAEPPDVDRIERALAARTQYQADQMSRHDREAVALLRRLSPRDRAAYARQLSPMTVWPPPPRCPIPPGQ